MKKTIKTKVKEPTVLFGLEIEACFPVETYDKTVRALRAIYGRGISFDYDCSIEVSWKEEDHYECRELRISPLPYEKALEKFKRAKVVFTKYKVKTNSTCGFHVNISEKNTFKGFEKAKKFALNFGASFPADKWLGFYRRKNNHYCQYDDYKRLSQIKNVYQCRYLNKYSKINYSHLAPYEPKYRRLEIRVAGGANYLNRSDNFLKEIYTHAKRSYVAAIK